MHLFGFSDCLGSFRPKRARQESSTRAHDTRHLTTTPKKLGGVGNSRRFDRRRAPAPHAPVEADIAMTTADDKVRQVAKTAQGYYDNDDVFNYYRQVWGEEHIHLGLYTNLQGEDADLEGVPRITKASSLSTQELLSRCFPSGDGPAPDKCTLMDMGAGYGGTARVAAKEFGCKVVCINISKKQNDLNVAMNKAAGLEDKITVPGEKSFLDTGMPDSSCDVVSSQDALLHAGSERHRALAEAARVLKPGGRMVFTDFMQTEEAQAKDLQAVYERVCLEDMATIESYQQWGKYYGLEFVEFTDLTGNLETHYTLLAEVLASKRNDMKDVGEQFIDTMLKGLESWKSTAVRGLLRWGFVVLRKPV